MESVTQADVDAVADELLKEYGYDIKKVIPNQVAVRLGKGKSNSRIGDLVANWKERRIAQGVGYVNLAPAELTQALDVLSEGIRRLTQGLVGKYLAQAGEKHTEKTQKLDDRYQKLLEDFDALKKKYEDVESNNERLMSEKKELNTFLEQKSAALAIAEARLEYAQKMIELFTKERPIGNPPMAEASFTSAVSKSAPDVDGGALTNLKKRGRPRKNPNLEAGG